MAASPVILKVTINHSVPFKTIMEFLSSFSNQEVNFEFTNDKLNNANSEKDGNCGLRIAVVDPTRALLIRLKIDAKDFAYYKCDRAKISFRVNINIFSRVIEFMSKDGNITLIYDLSNKNYIGIEIENPNCQNNLNLNLKILK